jgi:hypothetical protein
MAQDKRILSIDECAAEALEIADEEVMVVAYVGRYQ